MFHVLFAAFGDTMLANALMLVDGWGRKRRSRSRSRSRSWSRSRSRGGDRGRCRSFSGWERERRRDSFEEVRKKGRSKNETSKEEMGKEGTSKEGTTKEGTSEEGMKKEGMIKEGTSQERVLSPIGRRIQSNRESRPRLDSRAMRMVTSALWNRDDRNRIKFRRNFRFRPVLPGFGFVRPFFAHFCPFFAQIRPNSPVFARFRPGFAQIRPDSDSFVFAQILQDSFGFVRRAHAQFGQA